MFGLRLKILLSPQSLIAISVLLYYLFPYTPEALGFSPHIFVVLICYVAAFFNHSVLDFTTRAEKWIIGLVILYLAICYFFFNVPYNVPVLRAWFCSLLFFLALRKYFRLVEIRFIDYGMRLVLLLWIVASFAEAFLGEVGFVSRYFGGYPSVSYSSGLSQWSNLGAALMLPLLIWNIKNYILDSKAENFILFVFGVAALYLTMSRAGWLGFVFALVVYLYMSNNFKSVYKVILISLIGVVLAWSLPTKLDSVEPGGVSNDGRWSVTDYSAMTRVITIKVGLRAIKDYWITGVGNYQKYYQESNDRFLVKYKIDQTPDMTPHNSYIQLFSEFGIPLSLLLIWYIFSLMKDAMQNCINLNSIALQSSLMGMFIYLFFHDGLYERQVWILLGIITSYSYKSFSDEKE